MKWKFPAKTFFVGEYVALYGGPAIVLTTTPCFEVNLSNHPGLHDIHPNSPAGRWWGKQAELNYGLEWSDPYQGRGGVGASSAQFLGAYYASAFIQNKVITQQNMLEDYIDSSCQGVGKAPSGYDVLAQSMHGCVYINRKEAIYTSYTWPFKDLAFILLHTGKKLPTHQHLQDLKPLNGIDVLTHIVELAHKAFEFVIRKDLIEAVRAYHQQLLAMNLLASHTVLAIEELQKQDNILAIKGCGALGSDVLLLLVPSDTLEKNALQLSQQGWMVISTSDNLFENA